MAVMLIPALIVLAVLVVLVAGFVVLTRRQNRRVDEVEGAGADVLRYTVPQGQDPVAVLTALQEAGHDVVTEGEDVVVRCRSGDEREREQVRSAIEGATMNLDSDVVPGNRVRFADE